MGGSSGSVHRERIQGTRPNRIRSPWRLSCLPESGGECGLAFDRFPDVVMGCGTAVGRTGWPSRAGLAGFWCTGWAGGLRAEVPEPSPDPGRGEPTGRGGSLPWSAQIAGERPGEAELGVAGDDQPGPPVGGLSIADLGCGPAQGLLEQPEGVLKIEAAQERLPEPVDVGWGGAGA